MLDPIAECIILYMAVAVGITALIVLVRAIVGTALGCMSIMLKAVEIGERLKRLFTRQSADTMPPAAAPLLPVTPKGSLPVSIGDVPGGRQAEQHAVQRAERDVQHAEDEEMPAGRTPPTVGSNLPSLLPTVGDPAGGRQPSNPNESGTFEGVARGRHDGSANGWQHFANATPAERRPLVTPHPASATVAPSKSMTSMLARSPGLPPPPIPDADAAMRFRIWMLEFGLERIGRGHGELIAGIDLWWLAQRFAKGAGFRIGSRDRFFEELRKLPGVHKEEDRRVTRLRGARQKRVAYSFSPGVETIAFGTTQREIRQACSHT